jgi:hypothetical protein
MGDVERRTGDRFIADASRMDVGFVGQVHEIVDDKTVVASEAVERAAIADPIRTIVPMKVRNLRRIRQRRISRP